MSNLGKVFLVLTIIFSLVSAVLGFLLAQKKTRYAGQLAAVENALRSTPTVAYQGDFKANEAEPAATLTKAGQAIKKMQSELAGTQQRASDAETKLTAAQSQVQTLTTEATTAKRELEDKTTQLAGLQKTSEAVQAELKDIKDQLGGRDIKSVIAQVEQSQEQLKVLSAEKRIIEDSFAQAKSELDKFRELDLLHKQKIAPIDLDGKIVAINKSWNFVVLDVGKNNKLTEGVDLTIYRGDTLIGKVRTVSVEDNTAIADILPDWVKGDIQVGDRVLF